MKPNTDRLITIATTDIMNYKVYSKMKASLIDLYKSRVDFYDKARFDFNEHVSVMGLSDRKTFKMIASVLASYKDTFTKNEIKDMFFITFGLCCYAMAWAAFMLPFIAIGASLIKKTNTHAEHDNCHQELMVGSIWDDINGNGFGGGMLPPDQQPGNDTIENPFPRLFPEILFQGHGPDREHSAAVRDVAHADHVGSAHVSEPPVLAGTAVKD